MILNNPFHFSQLFSTQVRETYQEQESGHWKARLHIPLLLTSDPMLDSVVLVGQVAGIERVYAVGLGLGGEPR
jgi:hypothetical protein